MANTTEDFTKLVKSCMQKLAGAGKKCSVKALKDDSMNAHLKTFSTVSGKKKKGPGINMKIKYECPSCKKEWTSGCGNTQWYYKLETQKGPNGDGVTGYTLHFKVHSYYQKCEKCNVAGRLEPYEDESERLSKIFVNGLAKELGMEPPFTFKGQRGGNPRRSH